MHQDAWPAKGERVVAFLTEGSQRSLRENDEGGLREKVISWGSLS